MKRLRKNMPQKYVVLGTFKKCKHKSSIEFYLLNRLNMPSIEIITGIVILLFLIVKCNLYNDMLI